MHDDPLENTFYQFIALVCLIGGVLLLVFGMVSSQPGQTLLGILLLVMGILWVAFWFSKYWKLGR